jgi:hypothetical protein
MDSAENDADLQDALALLTAFQKEKGRRELYKLVISGSGGASSNRAADLAAALLSLADLLLDALAAAMQIPKQEALGRIALMIGQRGDQIDGD